VPKALEEEGLGEKSLPEVEIEIPQLGRFEAKTQSGGQDRSCTGAADEVETFAERQLFAGEVVQLFFNLDQTFGRNQAAQSTSIDGEKTLRASGRRRRTRTHGYSSFGRGRN
jgi:hypothetical protein